MHGFQNNFAQLLSLRRKSAVQNILLCRCRLKVKVTLEGQMIKWPEIELVRDITCTFMHCYAPNFEEVEGPNWFGPVRLSVHLLPFPHTPPPPKKKKFTYSSPAPPAPPPPPPPKKKRIWILSREKITYSSPSRVTYLL